MPLYSWYNKKTKNLAAKDEKDSDMWPVAKVSKRISTIHHAKPLKLLKLATKIA